MTRRLALLLAVSGEVAGTFEAAPGIRLDPADRLRLDLTLDLRLAQTRAWLQTRFTAEGETRLAGDRLRSRRRMLSGCVGAELPWAGSRFTVVGELARTGQVTLSDAWEYGVWREAGPAMIAALGLRATPPGRWEIGRGGALVGDLGLGWRRVLPEGLPYADGWAVEVTPRVRWLQGTRTYGLTLAWIRGHASGGFGGGAGDVRGWRFGIEVAWIGERAPLLPFAAEGEEP